GGSGSGAGPFPQDPGPFAQSPELGSASALGLDEQAPGHLTVASEVLGREVKEGRDSACLARVVARHLELGVRVRACVAALEGVQEEMEGGRGRAGGKRKRTAERGVA
ncbi:unnamed protein product, partial [Discosporangium mesarthrocarpum]